MLIGILGAGQLGMMLAEAGQSLGMTFRFLDPASQVSAGPYGEHICAAYEDIDALEEFVQGLEAITYEFENVRVGSASWLAERVPVWPPPEALRVAQDRLYEKTFFAELGIPSPKFADFFFIDEFREALKQIGMPAVLKTRRFGYDGKGQRVIKSQEEAEQAFKALHGIPLFLESFVPFERELSILAVRSRSGACAFYPLVENHHRGGILRLSIAPAVGVSAELQRQAESYARAAMEKLHYVGVLAIEFFEHQGQLFVNEMAPRVHNSGHWSIEGAHTSQFENHLRAVSGMEPGSTACRGVSAMVNCIGEMPPPEIIAGGLAGAVHDYHKTPRSNRKVGHTTLTAETHEELRKKLLKLAAGVEWEELNSSLAAARF